MSDCKNCGHNPDERRTEVPGSVQFLYPRKWWQLWKSGWLKHSTIVGPCWIRFEWPEDEAGSTWQPNDIGEV